MHRPVSDAGGDPSHSPNECRFRYAECRYCRKTGHIQSNCFTKKTADKRRKGNRAHHMTPATTMKPEGAEVNKIMPQGQAARRSEPEPPCNAQTCFRCGDPSHSPNECRFRYAECRYCKKTGHIQSNCFTKKTAD